MRQLLAILRGLNLIVAMVLAAIALQLSPSLFHGGIAGVHDHIVRVATAGVAPDHWNAAVARMYETLIVLMVFVAVLYSAQRFVGRRLSSSTRKHPPHTAPDAGSGPHFAQ